MKDKLGHPIFLISLLILLLNDWYLKAEFGNALTGKLSDFAGLIAFPFFFSALFPSLKKHIHISSALLFVIWNSALVQPLIEFANHCNIPIGRTIDITDNIALISIFISYYILEDKFTLKLKPLILKMVIVISCFAFMATSRVPMEKKEYLDINYSYDFEISKSELISRLNMIQIKEVYKFKEFSDNVLFDAEKNLFHFKGHTDTLAVLMDNHSLNNVDSLIMKTSFATMIINGDSIASKITLTKVAKFIPRLSDKNYEEKAVKEFEKRVIKKINKIVK